MHRQHLECLYLYEIITKCTTEGAYPNRREREKKKKKERKKERKKEKKIKSQKKGK